MDFSRFVDPGTCIADACVVGVTDDFALDDELLARGQPNIFAPVADTGVVNTGLQQGRASSCCQQCAALDDRSTHIASPPSNMPVTPCLRPQAAIELGVFRILPLARLCDAQAFGEGFDAVIRYRIGLLPNRYGREQLLNL